jgi:hypothetical protein
MFVRTFLGGGGEKERPPCPSQSWSLRSGGGAVRASATPLLPIIVDDVVYFSFRSVTTSTIKPTTNTNIRDLRCPAIVFNKTKHTSTEYPKRNFYTISSAISLVVIAFHPHNHHLDAQNKTGLVSSDKTNFKRH